MTKAVAFCLLIAGVAVWIILTAAAPWTIGDKNVFLRNFVNHEFLGFMGVVVSISIASASNVYIELNKFQERTGHPFAVTKANVRNTAFALVWALIAAVAVVIVKPLLADDDHTTAGANGFALLVMLCAIVLLIDLLQASFGLDGSKLGTVPNPAPPTPISPPTSNPRTRLRRKLPKRP